MGLEAGSNVSQAAVDQNRRLIGIANFGRIRGAHLSHAEPAIAEYFKDKTEVVVIPYAALNMDTSATNTMNALRRIVPNIKVRSLHEESGENVLKVLEEADGVFLGSGDTYVLGHRLHQEGLVDPLRQKASKGIVIAGASAGPLVMADTISGAADPTVPVVEENGKRVVQVDGLGLLPRHIHPVVHYINFDEMFTDEERKTMFAESPRLEVLFDHLHSVPGYINWHLRYNPNDIVYAMPDDTYFVAEGMNFTHHGEKAGLIFQAGKDRQVVEPGANLNHIFFSRAA